MLRFLLLILTFILVGHNAGASECGVFRVVKKQVQYKEKGKVQLNVARVNKKICSGDTVITAKEARAKIVMAGGNEINVSPDTELVIEEYENAGDNKKVMLNVVYGKIRANVNQKYEDNDESYYRVKTKSAVAGVRGTEFMTEFNKSTNQSRVVTFEGKVSVGSFAGGTYQPKVVVGAGQFTTNSPGGDPQPPRAVPQAELAQLNTETNVEPTGASDGAEGATGDRGVSNEGQDDQSAEENQGDQPEQNKNDQSGGNDEPSSGDTNEGANNNDKDGAGDSSKPKVGSSEGSSDGSGGGRGIASTQPDGGSAAGPNDNFLRDPATTAGNDLDADIGSMRDAPGLGAAAGGPDFADPNFLPPPPPSIPTPDVLNGVPIYTQPPIVDNTIQNQKANVIINICTNRSANCP